MLLSAAKLVFANATHVCQAFQRWQTLKKFVAFSFTTLLRDDLTDLTKQKKPNSFSFHYAITKRQRLLLIQAILAAPKIKHLVRDRERILH